MMRFESQVMLPVVMISNLRVGCCSGRVFNLTRELSDLSILLYCLSSIFEPLKDVNHLNNFDH